MKADDDPEHLDFVTISAHKMYAPFGTGALVGPKEVFLQGAPEYSGGGTVDVVTLDEVHWAGMPDRDEAGSPNVIGAVALAASRQDADGCGHGRRRRPRTGAVDLRHPTPAGDSRHHHLRRIEPGTRLHEKVGVIPFNLDGVSHFKLAAILGYEGGIGVRSGCFCAHPYVVHLLDLEDRADSTWRTELLAGDRSNMPGMVRMSFGCYNNRDDVDRLVAMLARVAAGDYQGDYLLDQHSGEYEPRGFQEPLESYFAL